MINSDDDVSETSIENNSTNYYALVIVSIPFRII